MNEVNELIVCRAYHLQQRHTTTLYNAIVTKASPECDARCRVPSQILDSPPCWLYKDLPIASACTFASQRTTRTPKGYTYKKPFRNPLDLRETAPVPQMISAAVMNSFDPFDTAQPDSPVSVMPSKPFSSIEQSCGFTWRPANLDDQPNQYIQARGHDIGYDDG